MTQDININVLDVNEIDLTDADNELIEGTEGDDMFNGVVSSLTTETTLSTTDSIDGKEGNDILNVTLSANFTGLSDEATITNVETIVLNNDTTTSKSFDATGITGLKILVNLIWNQ